MRARERTRASSYREVSRARRTFRPTVVESSVARIAESDSRELVTRVGCRYFELCRDILRIRTKSSDVFFASKIRQLNLRLD